MVSHGKSEDTNELANAGGNESVANVSPNTTELLEAIKIVVVSYFSEKSLLQHIIAGKISLPQASIIIQRMIVEPDYTFAVPKFFGISSSQMQEFMEKNLKIDVANDWKELISETKLNDNKVLTSVIETKNFPDSFLEKAKVIEANINQGFEEFIGNLKAEQSLSKLFSENDEKNKLNELISSIKSNNEKLMVRSTGKEDTDELANAGGNESVANVGPSTPQILEAIRIVVASYFSERSLAQRVAAGDRSLPGTPFTPILIQRMVGEKNGEPLPLCGVMFTEETEGALSKARLRDSNDQIKTTGITLVQAAYGHNEGVVNSIVAVDTHLVSNQGNTYSVVRPKRFRIAPTEALTLARRNNPDDLIQHQALSQEAILALKYLAVELENFYKKPMDVEYVIDEKARIIYIVQARPIIHNPDQPSPTYLDFDNPVIAKMSSVQGQTIGVGGGALQLISRSNEVIATRTIGDALTAYLDRKDKNIIKVILVGEMAPATSHEATTFRSELKPVICIPDNFSDVEQWLSDEHKLIIDTQQQRVAQWTNEEFDLATFLTQGFALEGWINYPFAQRLSVRPLKNAATFQNHKQNLVQIFKDHTSQLSPDERKSLSQSLKTRPKTLQQIKALIKTVKTGEQNQAIQALQQIWLFCQTLTINTRPGYIGRTVSLLNSIAQVMLTLLNQSDTPNLGIKQTEKLFLSKRLFPIHFLETLLFQHHNETQGLHSDSVIKLLTQMKDERRGEEGVTAASATKPSNDANETTRRVTFQLAKFHEIPSLLGNNSLNDQIKTQWTDFLNSTGENATTRRVSSQLAKLHGIAGILGNYSLNDQIRTRWIDFLNTISKTDLKQQIRFFKQLKTLANLGVLPLWLHTSFADSNDIKELNNQVVSAQKFLNTMLDYKQRIETLTVDGFSDPTKFLKTWDDFQRNILDYFTDAKSYYGVFKTHDETPDNFMATFTRTNRLGKLAALSAMERLVAQFDAAIKAVTGSTLFVVTSLPDGKTLDEVQNERQLLKDQINVKKDKIFTFNLMLQQYSLLLKQWLQLLGKNGIYFGFGSFTDDTRYFKSLSRRTNMPEQLLIDASFNVNSVVVGNTVGEYRRSSISTHEEFFTFCHQSLLAVLAKFTQKYGLQEKQFPPEALDLHNKILGLSIYTRGAHGDSHSPTLIGSQINGNQLMLSYNYPQRNHSASIKLAYNTKTKTNTLSLSLLGDNQYDRWYYFSEHAMFQSTLTGIPYKTSFSYYGVEVEWALSNDTQIEAALNMINTYCDAADYTERIPNLRPNGHIGIFLALVQKKHLLWGFDDAILKAAQSSNKENLNAAIMILRELLKPGVKFTSEYSLQLFPLRCFLQLAQIAFLLLHQNVFVCLQAIFVE